MSKQDEDSIFEAFNEKNEKSGITRAIEEATQPSMIDSVSLPICMSSIFLCKSEQNQRPSPYVYTRAGNPTNEVVEKQITQLYCRNDIRGSFITDTFPSGMAAISSLFWTLIEKDCHVLISNEVYHTAYDVLSTMKRLCGVTFNVVEVCGDHFSDIEKLIQPGKTKFLYFESCSNPTMKIPDFEKLMEVCRSADPNMKLICDNTWLSPIIFNPFQYDIDYVVESGSKYFSGTSSTIFGFVTSRDSSSHSRLWKWKLHFGAVVHPMASWMISKGVDNLELRMKAISGFGKDLALFLESIPSVTRVLYPTLPSHYHYRRAKKYFVGEMGSGVIYFHLMASISPLADELMKTTTIIKRSTSYGSSHYLWDMNPVKGISNENDEKNKDSTCTASEKEEESREDSDIEEKVRKKIKGYWYRLAIGLSSVEDIKQELLRGIIRVCGMKLGSIKKWNAKKNSIVFKSEGSKMDEPLFQLLCVKEMKKKTILKNGDWIALSNRQRTNFKLFSLQSIKGNEMFLSPTFEKNIIKNEKYEIVLKLSDWRDE